MRRRRQARRAFHIRRFIWSTSPKTPIYELGTIRCVQFFFFYYYRGVSSPCSLHGFLFSTHPAPCTPPNGVNPLVRRRARHDEQEVRAAVHNLLPRRLAGRHAVPREPDRAGHPRGSEQRPPPTRGAALAWEPRRRQVRRRPVHTDDGRVHGRFSHPEELPRHSRVTGQRQRQRWR